MRKDIKRMRLVAMAISVAAILGSGAVGVGSAVADTPNPLTGTTNSSDPNLMLCPDADGGGYDLCLYTSQDIGSGATSANGYPMKQTMLWTLKYGLNPNTASNWVARGAVAQESELTSAGVPSGSNHLWAPGAIQEGDYYYLYVPDVTSSNMDTSSRIFVFRSTSPTGGFTYQAELNTPVTGAPNGGYASDPGIILNYGFQPYLVYANGTFNNCGGLSIGELTDGNPMSLDAGASQLTINGISALGNCGGTGHPYMEGPSLYEFFNLGLSGSLGTYYLMFAAKPTSTPSGCAHASEVIAYATSNTITGPYTYQGIIMCGSNTEWTNQASAVQFPIGSGSVYMAYHDGPCVGSGSPDRKVHLAMLTGTADGHINQITHTQQGTSCQ